ncbi:hypothetical protein NDU88_010829 [Pleurodeles waltl]|uniref:Uncharacterized protein n=1 Tax=Pleurodeles waltl TaxID=8319 RepID=A0AAV7PZV8_PLEWA|nr:hypothetical protein NDU88_010829 [Pleurodeles waltl]
MNAFCDTALPPYKADELGMRAALRASTHRGPVCGLHHERPEALHECEEQYMPLSSASPESDHLAPAIYLVMDFPACTQYSSQPVSFFRESPACSPSEEGHNRSHHAPGFMNHPMMKVHNGAPELQRRPPPQEHPPNKILISQTVAREAPAYTNVIVPTPRNSSATANVPKRWKSERISKTKKAPITPVQVRRYPLRLRRPPVRLTF